MAETKAKIKLQYFRSKIATPVKHKLVVRGLGFTRNLALGRAPSRRSAPFQWSTRFWLNS